MKIIDCHANVGWDASNIRKNLIPTEQSPQHLMKKMDHWNVTEACILPFPSTAARFNQNNAWFDIENQYLLSAASQHKRLHVIAGVNPADPRSVENIATLAATGTIAGVKFSHQNALKCPIDKLIDHPLIQTIEKSKLFLMIHIGTGNEPGSQKYHTTLPYAIEVAQHYPKCKFLVCHLGRLHQSIYEALSFENISMDTSALSLHAVSRSFAANVPDPFLLTLKPKNIIEKLVKKGFEDKIIFGSDEPYTTYKQELHYAQTADISKEAKQKILSENIQRLLNHD